MAKEEASVSLVTTVGSVYRRIFCGLLILLVLLVLCYEIFGESIIRAAYEGRSIQILNNAIKFQHKKPVEHYISMADALFLKGLFVSITAIGYLAVITHLIFFKNALRVLWTVVLGVFALLGIYGLNPGVRVFSVHGFMHSGIVYEILHGHIPPQNPLIGGQRLLYPWGYEFLVASITKLTDIPISWVFAIINIASLTVIAFLVFKVSRLLINCPKANAFSVITAIFCSTWIARDDYPFLQSQMGLLIENRAVPLFDKLTNVNGVPIGMVFYMLFVYLLLKIFSETGKWKAMLPLLLVSVAGVGFFYLQMLPGLFGSFGLFFAVRSFQHLKERDGGNLAKVILTSAMVALGTLILLPYIRSLTGNVGSKIAILRPAYIWRDVKSLLLLSLPLLIIIFANFRNLAKLNRKSLVNLALLMTGAALSYLCVRFPRGNEYKFLIEATVLMGIIGGICISFMCVERKRVLVLIIMLVLARPFFNIIIFQLTREYSEPVPREVGAKLLADGEESELYEWILSETSTEDMFMDTKLSIPCLGQRQLFVAVDEYSNGRRIPVPGYLISMKELFDEVNVYQPELAEYRWRMVEKVYDSKITMDDEGLRDLFSSENSPLVVVRQRDLQEKFDREEFRAVFRSSGNNFAVFQYVGGSL